MARTTIEVERKILDRIKAYAERNGMKVRVVSERLLRFALKHFDQATRPTKDNGK
jgi:hypothetical protein